MEEFTMNDRKGVGVAGNPVLTEVSRWPGVTLRPGRRGELSVCLGRVEIGHMHGPGVAHFGFPKPLWTELIREGIVQRHPVDNPGWAERRIQRPEDVAEVIDLFRLNYERLAARVKGRSGGEPRTG